MKRCRKCGEEKPRSAFSPRGDSPDGLRNECRECKREPNRLATQRWREQNPEKSRQQFREWREENIEHDRERCRQYDEANRDRRREAMRKRRQQDRKRDRELQRAQRARDRAKLNQRSLAYYYTRRDAGYLTPEQAAAIVDQPCAYCGATEGITLDHIVPISRGGTNALDNLAPACGPCNSSKGARLLSEWAGPPTPTIQAA